MEDLQFQIIEPEAKPKGETPKPPRGNPKSRRGTVSSTGGRAVRRPTPQAEFGEMEDTPEDAPFGEQSLPAREIVEKPERVSAVEAKTGAPSLDEWQDFFGRFLIRMLVDAYLYLVLGDLIDELSKTELDSIKLSKEEMKEIAAPLAEMSNKSSFMKKHGRSIIATTESYESVMTLLFWMNRVNRIAKRHRKANPKPRRVRGHAVPREDQNNARNDGNSSGEVGGAVPPAGLYNPNFG